MIEEAYCSFEIAKLLKEKGFDEPCNHYYENNNLMFSSSLKGRNSYQTNTCSAPTHQMAMAWLREMHYLWIDIDQLTNYKWAWSIWLMNDANFKMGETSQVTSNYKEAVEAALKYALENLV